MRRGLPIGTVLGAALGVMVAGATWLHAQAAPSGRTAWDGVYTDAQATRAAAVFDQSCARCHSLAGDGQRPLSGEAFWEGFSQKSVGDLLTYITTSMPNGNPGTLAASTYADLTALILRANAFPAGQAELSAEAAGAARIVPKDGSSALPANTLARVVGCLVREGNDWVLTSASSPERIDKTGTVPEDATRPLGDRSIALKFVLTRLNNFVGQRMAVTGILMGADGADGINVSTVDRVGETCP